MPFCTVCGANVTGTFCSQCGTPAKAAAGQAPPPVAAQSAAAQPAPAGIPPGAMPPPAARKTSPLVWILVALGGFILLCVIGAFAIGAFFIHKAHQAGLDTDLIRRNPAAAVARMAAMANKDVDIVGEDDRTGTITLRDRHTGKTVTMSFDQVKSGFRISADEDNGKTAVVEFGAGAGKLPAWIPAYPRSDTKGTFSVTGNSNDRSGQGGNYTFTTSDDPAKVMSFYDEKVKELHMIVKLTANGSDGGTLVATEDPERRMLTVLVGRSGGETTVNVTYADKH